MSSLQTARSYLIQVSQTLYSRLQNWLPANRVVEIPDVSLYGSPARAIDLSGLPPTFVDVGSAKLFRDELAAYASNIWRCGGEADLHVFAGGFHDYSGFVPNASIFRDTCQARIGWLRRIMRRCSEENNRHTLA